MGDKYISVKIKVNGYTANAVTFHKDKFKKYMLEKLKGFHIYESEEDLFIDTIYEYLNGHIGVYMPILEIEDFKIEDIEINEDNS